MQSITAIGLDIAKSSGRSAITFRKLKCWQRFPAYCTALFDCDIFSWSLHGDAPRPETNDKIILVKVAVDIRQKVGKDLIGRLRLQLNY
jgi:hypothetical protein